MKLAEVFSIRCDCSGLGYLQVYFAWSVTERPKSRNIDVFCPGFDGDGREEAEQWLNSLFTREEAVELEAALISHRPGRYLAFPLC